MTRLASAVAGAVLVGLPTLVAAQPPTAAPSFITPAALAAQLNDPDLVLLHVGDKDAYATEHLPGARLVTLPMITAAPQPGLQNEMPEPAELETRLEALGIGDTSRVVVYFAKFDPMQVASVARVTFTLDYAGLGARTSILDGGMPAWVKAGQQVSADVPPAPAAASLTVRPRTEALVDLAWLRGHVEGTQIVDARPRPFYTGDDDRNGELKRPGHVPGAVNLPFVSFFQEDGTLKPEAELTRMLADAGITKGTPIVTYCHSGVQASVPYVVARMLGYEAKVYDGSFQQWSASDAPVVKGASPR